MLPTSHPLENYQYLDVMLKHMPKDSLETYEKMLLYSNKLVQYRVNLYRCPNNNANTATRTYENIIERL